MMSTTAHTSSSLPPSDAMAACDERAMHESRPTAWQQADPVGERLAARQGLMRARAGRERAFAPFAQCSPVLKAGCCFSVMPWGGRQCAIVRCPLPLPPFPLQPFLNLMFTAWGLLHSLCWPCVLLPNRRHIYELLQLLWAVPFQLSSYELMSP